MLPVSLEYVPVCESLAPYFTFFYEYRTSVPQVRQNGRAALAQLRFTLSGQTFIEHQGGTEEPFPEIYLHGPTTVNTVQRADGEAHVVGVGIQPAGWAAITHIAASLVVNQVLNAEYIFGFSLQDCREAIRHASDFPARIKIFEGLLRRLMDESDGVGQKFIGVVDEWLQSSLCPDVTGLVKRSQLSQSQVERNCKRYYGMPPKTLVRKYRALRAAVLLASGKAEQIDLIGEGFYDQAHFIREIKHFTGLTPKSFCTHPDELTKLSLLRNRYLGLNSLIGGT